DAESGDAGDEASAGAMHSRLSTTSRGRPELFASGLSNDIQNGFPSRGPLILGGGPARRSRTPSGSCDGSSRSDRADLSAHGSGGFDPHPPEPAAADRERAGVLPEASRVGRVCLLTRRSSVKCCAPSIDSVW